MKKRIRNINVSVARMAFVVMCAIGLYTPLQAETVSQKEAKVMAQQFFNQLYGETVAPVKYVYNGKRLTTDRLFTPFYVYNHQRGGFVIISAENKTFPILAYSLKGSFDPDGLSAGERGWLKGYAEDIERIRYDSRVPEEALKAWQDYPHYLAALLDAKYDATDPVITEAESADMLDRILRAPDDMEDGNFSAVYTPEQWQDLIDGELTTSKSVALGVVDFKKNLTPGVVYGRKGDYYRIAFDRLNDWLLRLMPAEFLGDRQVAALSAPTYVPEEENDEPPFTFYESFLAEQRREAEAAAIRELEGLIPSTPIVKAIGGGHFEVEMPENIRLAMVYNMNGAHIGRYTYGDTNVAHINIESEPRGFYFALIYSDGGKPYGVKLYR